MKNIVLLLSSCALLAACAFTSCSKPLRIIVGSKPTTEQKIVAEITAQHLERRLGDTVKVERRFSMGDTTMMHQAVVNGDVDLYPEDTGLALSQILHEVPGTDPQVVLSRARSEMARVHLLDFLDPLGFDNRTVMVVPASLPTELKKLSQAGEVAGKKSSINWNVASTLDFVSREGGLAALNGYHLPMASALRTLKATELFPLLQKGDINMAATQSTDYHLLSSDWRILEDDLQVFPPRETALLVRQELSGKEPRLKAILSELSGKISLDAIRKMMAQVDVDKQPVPDVAAKFLEAAAIK